jgi:small subunit ribosomal protein S1
MHADMLSHQVPVFSNKTKGVATADQSKDSSFIEEVDQPLISKTSRSGNNEDAFTEPDWALASQIYEQDRAIEVTITGYNKGGLLTNWGGLPGFLPASQLEDFPECHLISKRLQALAAWVGQDLTVKIIELEQHTNRFVLSERAASITADERTRLLNRIKPGDKLKGIVTNLAAFGVFVDLGGVEGLIHISELSWGRVANPGDVVSPGQALEVVVLQIERETERIALSRKRLLHNPWQAIEERYKPGQRVDGVITNIAKFGAFAEVEKGLEGLIHVSEITDQPFSTPSEVLEVGELVRAWVLEVDGERHRLALSLKSVSGSQ